MTVLLVFVKSRLTTPNHETLVTSKNLERQLSSFIYSAYSDPVCMVTASPAFR